MIKDFLTRFLGGGTRDLDEIQDLSETRDLDKGPRKQAYKDYVIQVLDGDTLLTQSNPNYIKLAEVTAPELDTPEGKKAKEFLASLLEGKTVSVEQVSKEESGRPVAKVWYAGLNVNDYVNGYIDA